MGDHNASAKYSSVLMCKCAKQLSDFVMMQSSLETYTKKSFPEMPIILQKGTKLLVVQNTSVKLKHITNMDVFFLKAMVNISLSDT